MRDVATGRIFLNAPFVEKASIMIGMKPLSMSRVILPFLSGTKESAGGSMFHLERAGMSFLFLRQIRSIGMVPVGVESVFWRERRPAQYRSRPSVRCRNRRVRVFGAPRMAHGCFATRRLMVVAWYQRSQGSGVMWGTVLLSSNGAALFRRATQKMRLQIVF